MALQEVTRTLRRERRGLATGPAERACEHGGRPGSEPAAGQGMRGHAVRHQPLAEAESGFVPRASGRVALPTCGVESPGPTAVRE